MRERNKLLAFSGLDIQTLASHHAATHSKPIIIIATRNHAFTIFYTSTAMLPIKLLVMHLGTVILIPMASLYQIACRFFQRFPFDRAVNGINDRYDTTTFTIDM
ncbi:hypothetical protein BDR07DRAFT_1405200, partial [Suillus spraguei]